jgi:ligand-binding sensor domain-containing protein
MVMKNKMIVMLIVLMMGVSLSTVIPAQHSTIRRSNVTGIATAKTVISTSCAWENVTSGTSSDLYVLSLAIDSAGTIYAGTLGKNMFKSTNKGISWTEINDKNGLTDTSVNTLAIDSAGVIYAGTENSGVFKSTDKGISWTEINNGLKNKNIFSLAIDSTGTIYVGTQHAGIFKSTNKGTSWTEINNGLTDTRVYALAIDSTGTIYAAAGGSIFKSTDKGTNWKQIDSKSINTYVLSLAIDSAGTVYAGTWNGVFKSTDKGISWTEINNGLPDTSVNVLAIDSGGAIYTGTDVGVFKSIDKGTSWTEMNNGLINKNVNALAIDSAETVYAGTRSGVFKYVCYASGTTTIQLWPDNPMMTVNGKSQEIDPGRGTKPVIIPAWSRTVVPIRAIVEALGGTISWDGTERKVTINFKTTAIELWIDNSQAKVNGTMVYIDPDNHSVKPIIINDRTMLPLRFVAESLGCEVGWDNDTRTITITYSG